MFGRYRTHRTKTGSDSLLLLVCCVLVSMSGLVLAQGRTKMEVGFWGSGDYTDCDSSRAIVYYVGGRYDVTVTQLPDGKRLGEVEYTGISDWSWPKGLVIKAGQASRFSEPFQASEPLTRQLQFEYYVTKHQAHRDSVWKATGESPPPLRTAPEYHFAFCVPPELAGFVLCVTAEWNHPRYGHLTAEKPACMRIHAPCSDVGRHAVWRTLVAEALQQSKFDLTVALADSFVTLGWHDLLGLLLAGNAAREIRRYDDAIRFLDICFETNHTVAPSEDPTPLSAPTEAGRRDYEWQRARLVELKNQQEQR